MNERPLPIVHVSPARPSKRREQDWYYSRILRNAINQRGAHAGCFLVNIKRLSSIKHRTPRLLRKIIQHHTKYSLVNGSSFTQPRSSYLWNGVNNSLSRRWQRSAMESKTMRSLSSVSLVYVTLSIKANYT